MNARLYDPALGRFLSPDPYVQAPNFSQSFNRYSYCMNNPLMYVDEDGEWFGLDDLTGFAVGGAAGGYAGGLLMTGDFNQAHKAGLSGAISGASIGSIAGAVGGYAAAGKAEISPLNGKPKETMVYRAVSESELMTYKIMALELIRMRQDIRKENYFILLIEALISAGSLRDVE